MKTETKTKIMVKDYRSFDHFVKDCRAAGIRLVKVSSRGWTEPKGRWMVGVHEVTATAFSLESPVLRTWKTRKYLSADVPTVQLELEGFCVKEDEWTADGLEELLNENVVGGSRKTTR